jgi:hypothetical protein
VNKTATIKKWEDIIANNEHVFEDGSVVTEVHEKHYEPCYKFTLAKHPKTVKNPTLTVSEGHYILCDISKLDNKWKRYITYLQETSIPGAVDLHLVIDNGKVLAGVEQVVKLDSWIVDAEKNHVWLNAKTIFTLLESGQKVFPVGNKFKQWEYVGELECFCVSTDTGRYKCCGVVSHNSVTLRNVVFHALTHSDDIVLGLVDLKLSEFSYYKGISNICGVANTVNETAELLRVAREVMYKRNQENADMQLTDFMDFKPQGPTNIIKMFGREFPDDQEFDVRIGEEQSKMTAGQVLEYVQNNY